MDDTHDCPICGAPVRHMERYPRQVCGNCQNRTRDASGNPVSYLVISLFGGIIATYEDGSRYAETFCWIDGKKCEAGEHRFGGIVVEAVEEPVD